MKEVPIFLFDDEGAQQWQIMAEWVSSGSRDTEIDLTETIRKFNPDLLTNKDYAEWVAFCPAPPRGGLAATAYLGQEAAEEKEIDWGNLRVRHLYLWRKDGTPVGMFNFRWNPDPGETTRQTVIRCIFKQLPNLLLVEGIATFHAADSTIVINVEDLRRANELR